MNASVKAYGVALEGLMVSHRISGGGVIMRVTWASPEPLVAVRFRNGLRRAFPLSAALEQLESLWSIASAPVERFDPEDIEGLLNLAQTRHELRQTAHGDLRARILAAEGCEAHAAFQCPASWAW